MSRLEDALNKAYQSPAPTRLPGTPRQPSSAVGQASEIQSLSSLYTNIQLALPDVARPIIAFTSAVPKEGVTSILYHLGGLISREKKVLLVDFNILSPGLHKFMQVDNIKGLSDVLQGKKGLADCIPESLNPNLDVLPCGPTGAASFQIMGSGVVRSLLAEMRSVYDVVLVDCPSLRNFPDAAILCALCDGVVLVVKTRKTKREVIQYSQELLVKAGARELGVVLNRVRYYIPEFIYRRL
ncbi:MAG: CpsD/CapB family tyrosine-protein kinase [Candidatus Omnitrophica bacterium]|jgi:capsular exopolysaccharide synthesis family protein|nr:MAG: Tyrosine-protein kinase YwqD [Candidatus Hinthialibacteria bacterium OLB16]MBE7486809.1 CpsD/CapB family tyrosine-protein kinase [bacterium]MCC6734177.1 CpsD/CapB family tyrosine-protein kinase [Candidatus Omnitrophota bacterium]MCE7909783.1 hypothetical protein [Candidatus Omnitrophica bacterium COP1]MBV6480387.1 putative tyrosine-protein kinase YveL [bacterium]